MTAMRTLLHKSIFRVLAFMGAAVLTHAQTHTLTPSTTTCLPGGGTITFTATQTYTTAPSTAAWIVTLPAGWTYVSGTNEPPIKPTVGRRGTLEWIYITVPPSPATFTFTVAYPAGVSQTASVTPTIVTRSAAAPAASTATPASVTVAPAPPLPPPPPPPVIIAPAKSTQSITLSAPASLAVGRTTTLVGSASSGLPLSYSVVSGPGSITDATLTALDEGAIVVRANQAGNSSYFAASSEFTVAAVRAQAQTITLGSVRQKDLGDAPFELDATASSRLPVTYRVVSGPASLINNTLTVTGAGTVVVEVSQGGNAIHGAAPTALWTIEVVRPARLINLSVRSRVGDGDQPLILGSVVTRESGDAATMNLLVRAIGPGAIPFGMAAETVLVNPRLSLFDADRSPLGQNDDWGGTQALRDAFSATGAFGLPGNSRDAACVLQVPDGVVTSHVRGEAASAGLALVELYAISHDNGPRLRNVSARADVGAGENILIAGFVLHGTRHASLLVRAIGPSLISHGVPADTILQNPQLTVFKETAVVAHNDDWQGHPDIKAAANTVGAFDLDSDTSKDAACVVTLEPGLYTVQVAGVANTTGHALVEIYHLP